MWSRRKFIYSALSSFAFWAYAQNNSAHAFGNRHSEMSPQIKAKVLIREYWSPAITSNLVEVFADNYCCLVDEFGHLGTANILPAAEHGQGYSLLGETISLGSKVLYFKVIQPQLAIAIVQRLMVVNGQTSRNSFLHSKLSKDKEADTHEEQLALVTINLEQPRAPQIVSISPLSQFTQITGLAAGGSAKHSIVATAGIDKQGKNSICIFGFKKNKNTQLLSTFILTNPIKSLSLIDKQLFALHPGTITKVSIIDIANESAPHFLRTVDLPGEVNEILSSHNTFAFAAMGDPTSIYLGDVNKFPQAAKSILFNKPLLPGGLALNDKYLFTVTDTEEFSTAVPYLIGENFSLTKQKEVNFTASGSTASKIVLGHDCAFVSSNWAGVEVLTLNHNGAWKTKTCSSIQKLPASALVSSANYLLIAAAELQLYDIAQPRQAKLINSAKLPSTIKTMVTTGSYVLYLDKSGISLCKVDNPKAILASFVAQAEHFSLDQKNHKGYLIQITEELNKKKSKEKITKLLEMNVFNNSIESAKTFSILNDSYCSSADEGYVLVGALNSLAVYKPDQSDNELVCQKEFTNLAWRQIILRQGNIFATAVDDNLNGYFMTLSFDGQTITLNESIKIPHDGAALTIAEDKAFTSGRNAEGNSIVTIIDTSNLAKPQIVLTKPTIESAAAIVANKNLVIVAGQGYEIFSF